ncbi:hypothetical protein DPM19_15240 [Actinomadura craniellae]|uniref:Polysaccharide chain length determinant N-terminal domain-containing protein n=1 Tax=Actinomadura craniellae TaxID=2231787 RepID=A0A365H7T4_9ACTN|nr:Wzz/FepE/Etk N-terminal domain-containing protein [Actinomadura craniellae]RAY14323.1 hypothetical protein DPM19_15240 [Actinomadura craniellae]
MDTLGPSGTSEVVDYGAVLRRRWRVVLSGALAGLFLAGLYVIVAPKTYTSQASVHVTPTGIQDSPNSNSQIRQGLNLDTEAQIMQSVAVALKARELLDRQRRLPGMRAEQLRQKVSVTVPPNSTILVVSFAGSNPRDAAAGAQALAEGYLNHRKQVAEENLASQINRLSEQIKNLNTKLQQGIANLGRQTRAGARRNYLAAQLNLMNRQLTDFQSRQDSLQSLTVLPGRVISSASVPQRASSPNIPLLLGSGLVLGLLAGLTGGMFRDRLDRRVRSAADVERLVDLPVLLDLIDVAGRDQSKKKAWLGLLPARSRAGQAFHELGHTIDATLGAGNHVILVTGASPGRGGAVVAANLAAALARTESGVALICANLHSSVSARLLGIPNGPGLAELLLRSKTVREVVQRPAELDRLRVIPPGFADELASERLQTAAMTNLVAELRKGVKYIVIEAPSASVSADAQALAEVADASVIVIEAPRARDVEINESVSRLDRMRVAVLGAVVVQEQGAAVEPGGGKHSDESPSPSAAAPKAKARSTKSAEPSQNERPPRSSAGKPTAGTGS